MRDLYSAPRPPQKKRASPTPRAPASGQFVPKDAINDRDVFEFASQFDAAMQVVLQGFAMLSMAVEPGSREARVVAGLGSALASIGGAVREGLTLDVKAGLGPFPPVPGKED